jgi:glycerol-3-phosphate dehydrogenase
MKRNIAAFSGVRFDLAVIGGGITGAAIARDAARRGLSVALIDKGDFSGGTSSRTSKLVHGGLRYLKQFQIGVVRESLAERAAWLRIAPHLVHPLPFLLPLPDDVASRFVLRTGLRLYDALAKAGASTLPAHRKVDAPEAERLERVLAGGAPNGALLYYDAQMESPERLGLECVIDATRHGAVVANYAACTGAVRAASGAVEGVTAKDAIGGSAFELRARVFVNAAGPWADLLLSDLAEPSPFVIRKAKGAHVVVKKLLVKHALALQSDGRHLFVIPWRGKTLIGTTDTEYAGKPEDARPTSGEIDATYGASRAAEIVEHGKSGGAPNLYSVVGGKWTTSRAVAEHAVDRIVEDNAFPARPCDTHLAPLPYSSFSQSENFLERAYGASAQKVAALAGDDVRLKSPFDPIASHIGAEFLFAVREEMALTLDDALFRRTQLGPLGGASGGAIAEAARIMGDELGWGAARRAEEAAAVKRKLSFR